MKGKKILSLFCAAALTLSLAACGSKTSDYSGQTITGEITDIDGTAVTMQLGELSEGGMLSHSVSDGADSGQTPPDKPDGETPSGNSSSPTAVSRPQSPTARAVIPAASLRRNLMAGPRAAAPPAAWAAAALPRARRV